MPSPNYYVVDCATDGDVPVWATSEPTECPNSAEHTVNGVSDNGPAWSEFFLYDGTGKVFKITVDTSGTIQTTQVYPEV